MQLNCFIPARSGSERVRHKNLERFGSQSLIQIAVEQAVRVGIFNRVILTSDSENYLAEVNNIEGVTTVLREGSISQSTSLDIDWLMDLEAKGLCDTEGFAILRPTSPFRTDKLIFQAVELLCSDEAIDSVRAVAKVKEHPGKMWRLDREGNATPFLRQPSDGSTRYHAMQYRSLETLYVQTSVLEVARTRVLETGTREGALVRGLVTSGVDSMAIDTEQDLALHRFMWSELPSLIGGKGED